VTLFEHLKSILHANASASHVFLSLLMSQLIKTMEQHLIVFCCHLGPLGPLSNDIFFGVVGYQGYKKKKYVECFIFLFGEVMFKFIKIGGLCN